MTDNTVKYLYVFGNVNVQDTYKIGITSLETKSQIIDKVISTNSDTLRLLYFRKLHSSGEAVMNLLSKYLIHDDYYMFDKCTNIVFDIRECMMMEYNERKSKTVADCAPVKMTTKSHDYTQAKIYLLRNRYNDTDMYVGSTIQPLFNRLEGHMCESERSPNSKVYATVASDWKNWYIELYEEFPCETLQQLHRREGEVQRRLCSNLNTAIAGRTKEEYMLENREKINDRAKEYYQKNSEKVKLYNRDVCIQAKRYVRELNAKVISFEKSRKATVEKYKIYVNDDGVYCSGLL